MVVAGGASQKCVRYNAKYGDDTNYHIPRGQIPGTWFELGNYQAWDENAEGREDQTHSTWKEFWKYDLYVSQQCNNSLYVRVRVTL